MDCAQEDPQAMIVLGPPRAVTQEIWSKLAVRTAMEEIVADAIAHFQAEWCLSRPVLKPTWRPFSQSN
jgi:hypothetical protein